MLPSNKKYTGFLLLELVFTIGIFCFFVLLVIQYHWNIVKNNKETLKYMEALNIATSIADELKIYKKPIKNLNLDDCVIQIETIKIDTYYEIYKINVMWKSINNQKKEISIYSGVIK